MSAFGIFALILTTAYILYFAAVIAKDVTASKKSPDAEANTETFDVSSFAQEESVEVKETNGGFAVGDNETQTETVAETSEEKEDVEESGHNSAEKIKEVTDQMDDSEQDVQFEVSVPDSNLKEFVINQQIFNRNINTSYMFDRRETAAAEPQKSSAGNGQGRDAM